MRFHILTALVLAAGTAFAQTPTGNAFNVPSSGYRVAPGSQLQLNWQPSAGQTVTLTLRSGSPGALDQGTIIQANIPNNGHYTWSVPSNLPAGSDYTIEITNDQDPSQTNYTPPVAVAGAYASLSSSSSMSFTSFTSFSTMTTSGAMTMSTSNAIPTTTSSQMTTTTSSDMTTSTRPATRTSSQTPSASMIDNAQPSNAAGGSLVRRIEWTVGALGMLGLGVGYAL